jgi:gliding motility-associated protein GldC
MDPLVKKISEITIKVGLDAQNMPIKMEWAATDMYQDSSTQPCKAMALAIFDEATKDTLRIDLWTKDMQVAEMDRFMYQLLQSLGSTYLRATQNKELAEDLARFAHYFGERTEIIPRGK